MGGEATGAAQLRAAVRKRADRAVNVVKIIASGGLMTSHTDVMRSQFEADELRLVVEEAPGHGSDPARMSTAIGACSYECKGEALIAAPRREEPSTR